MSVSPRRVIRGGGGGLARPRVTVTREGDRVVARRPGVTVWSGVWASAMGLITLASAIDGQIFMMVLTAAWATFSWRLIRMARLSIAPESIRVRRFVRDVAVPTSARPRFSVVDRRGFYGSKYRVLAVEHPSGAVATASAFSSGSGTGKDDWLHETAACLNEAMPSTA